MWIGVNRLMLVAIPQRDVQKRKVNRILLGIASIATLPRASFVAQQLFQTQNQEREIALGVALPFVERRNLC
jgi:hypothetical protein